jgi:hypothetical protein
VQAALPLGVKAKNSKGATKMFLQHLSQLFWVTLLVFCVQSLNSLLRQYSSLADTQPHCPEGPKKNKNDFAEVSNKSKIKICVSSFFEKKRADILLIMAYISG